jgi:hypothetical protein
MSQTGTGRIQGTVKDISGAVVPKAKVTLVHTATNRQYRTETTGVGFYLFPSIQLGDYQLTVELPGMETWKGQLHLLTGQTAEVEAVLKPGSTAATAEISSEVAPLVTTTSATLATVVEPQRIEHQGIRPLSNLAEECSFNDQMPTYLWYATTHQPLPTGSYANVATPPYDQQLYGTMYEFENIGWSNDQN